MEILEILKRIKNIEPDKDFSRKSKLVILSTPQLEPAPGVFRLIAASGLRFGSALVLSAGMILILLGGFSLGKQGSGVLAGLDPRGLKAEAQAIDIQIQLVNLGYDETKLAAQGNLSAIIRDNTTTVKFAKNPTVTIKNKNATTITGAPTSTKEVTIDDILGEISN